MFRSTIKIIERYSDSMIGMKGVKEKIIDERYFSSMQKFNEWYHSAESELKKSLQLSPNSYLYVDIIEVILDNLALPIQGNINTIYLKQNANEQSKTTNTT